MRPEMKFHTALKKTFFIAGEMKRNLVLGVALVKQPIQKCKQTRARYIDKDVGGNNSSFTLNQHNSYSNKSSKF